MADKLKKTSTAEAIMGCSIFILIGIGCCLFPFCGCESTYAVGHRDGVLQKLSYKGWFVKTWEAELAMPGFRVRGESTDNTFPFSFDDESLVKELEDLPPEVTIRVHYRQVLWNAKLWHGSSYRVTKIERTKAKE